MTFERRQILVGGVAAFFLVLLIAGVLASSIGSSGHGPVLKAGSPSTITFSPEQSSGWTPVTPATDVPTDTPVQAQYDQALASGLRSSSSIQAADVAPVPTPAFTSSWPALPVATTPEQWAEDFTHQLLDIDFAHQSRAALGSWLSAEEAAELLPGVPTPVADKVLYLSLFDSAAVGGGASPIPDDSAWQADGRSGIHWQASDLLVQPDPQFSQILSDGWQPVDRRFTVEDVSGLLAVIHGQARITRHFSMTVYLGSAHWHQGYGTVLVDNWQEN
jgi:hypothetical protein